MKVFTGNPDDRSKWKSPGCILRRKQMFFQCINNFASVCIEGLRAFLSAIFQGGDILCILFHFLHLLIGTPFTQQSYKVSESFPFKWISKKWREGFHVTSMATAGSRWGIVMSRNAGFTDQVSRHSF